MGGADTSRSEGKFKTPSVIVALVIDGYNTFTCGEFLIVNLRELKIKHHLKLQQL